LDAVVNHPKICKTIHLPLQSGNDRILGLMDRTYTRAEYLRLVEDIRRRRADIVLTTDIICGFCTESEDDFMDTYHLVEDVGYHMAYVFKYSERKHTIAARKYPDDVFEQTKIDRVNRLSYRLKIISHERNLAEIGKTVPVLVEGDAKKSSSQWMGKTDGGITVVWEKSDLDVAPGDVVQVTITNVSATTLFGQPVVL
jgi:tRNA-2-methylthio-N6-dimethylallyladenosine synthase